MSHAIRYLETILTPAQLDTWREARRQDTQDSIARTKFRQLMHLTKLQAAHPNALLTPKIQARRQWLKACGYIDECDQWTNKTYQ